MKSLVWHLCFETTHQPEIQSCENFEKHEKEEPRKQDQQLGTRQINMRAIYPGGSTTAAEPWSRAWVTEQFNVSTGTLLSWHLLLGVAGGGGREGLLKTQYSFSCYIIVSIQTYLQLPIMLMFIKVGGFVPALGFSPPLEHYLCSCKSIKLLRCNADTKTTHLVRQHKPAGESSHCGEAAHHIDAITKPQNERLHGLI